MWINFDENGTDGHKMDQIMVKFQCSTKNQYFGIFQYFLNGLVSNFSMLSGQSWIMGWIRIVPMFFSHELNRSNPVENRPSHDWINSFTGKVAEVMSRIDLKKKTSRGELTQSEVCAYPSLLLALEIGNGVKRNMPPSLAGCVQQNAPVQAVKVLRCWQVMSASLAQ